MIRPHNSQMLGWSRQGRRLTLNNIAYASGVVLKRPDSTSYLALPSCSQSSGRGLVISQCAQFRRLFPCHGITRRSAVQMSHLNG